MSYNADDKPEDMSWIEWRKTIRDDKKARERPIDDIELEVLEFDTPSSKVREVDSPFCYKFKRTFRLGRNSENATICAGGCCSIFCCCSIIFVILFISLLIFLLKVLWHSKWLVALVI
eukprot:TRINITY_DN1118_c0_g1_i1.p1 TRINITY_DN1118_c0_g1~~TRINITY_DN1118_c0_g1_i1.p1  ORF type:complete len:118 (-),score=37.05 TRINITY_DN1118_c0_g1_i1:267-620(-)